MRASVQLISKQVEQALAHRDVSPFSQKVRSAEYVCFGISALDALTCGVPVGAVTEMVGSESSGRTTAALSVVSELVHGGSVCAWIDVSDTFDPESASANGVDLARLLWVRCGGNPPSPSKPAQSVSVPMPERSAAQAPHPGGGKSCPRSDGRDMPEAADGSEDWRTQQVRAGKRMVGTPGAPNRPVSYRSEHREEQVNSDRLPPRRGDNLAILPRYAGPRPRQAAGLPSGKRDPGKRSHLREDSAPPSKTGVWKPLDQALRTTDLLLQSGGFSAIVLDLGGVSPEFAWRIPLATWFRFRAACERTRTSLILLTQHPCARSSAELVLRFKDGMIEAHVNVMARVCYEAAIERSRFVESELRVVPIRKPPQAERPGQWACGAAWA